MGHVVQGHDTTLPVTLDEVIYHCRMVSRAVRRALVVGDMPFGSYQVSVEDALRNAVRIMKEGGAHAVKLEGGERMADRIAAFARAEIPVMGHVGLTPQSVHQFGGYRVQGRGDEGHERVLRDAKAVQDAGAFAVVLEMVPADAARQVTELLHIPTISVGGGPHCDGQLLVWTDWAGLTTGRIPKFVKQYANLAGVLSEAATAWRADVASGAYPTEEHSY